MKVGPIERRTTKALQSSRGMEAFQQVGQVGDACSVLPRYQEVVEERKLSNKFFGQAAVDDACSVLPVLTCTDARTSTMLLMMMLTIER